MLISDCREAKKGTEDSEEKRETQLKFLYFIFNLAKWKYKH